MSTATLFLFLWEFFYLKCRRLPPTQWVLWCCSCREREFWGFSVRSDWRSSQCNSLTAEGVHTMSGWRGRRPSFPTSERIIAPVSKTPVKNCPRELQEKACNGRWKKVFPRARSSTKNIYKPDALMLQSMGQAEHILNNLVLIQQTRGLRLSHIGFGNSGSDCTEIDHSGRSNSPKTKACERSSQILIFYYFKYPDGIILCYMFMMLPFMMFSGWPPQFFFGDHIQAIYGVYGNLVAI